MTQKPSSSRIVLTRIRNRQRDVRRLTNADAEWLIGDREEPQSFAARLRSWFGRNRNM